MGGLFQVLWNNTSLSLWADGANSLIESYGNGSLLLNYHCGKDVVVGNANSGNLIVNRNVFVPSGIIKIGVLFPQNHTDARLSVDGKAVFKDAWITMKNWADDEFDKDITLDTLIKEMEFAIKYKHLPGIEGENEIKNEGLYMNEIIQKQMMLIERLYKYAYLLNKEIEILEKDKKQIG